MSGEYVFDVKHPNYSESLVRTGFHKTCINLDVHNLVLRRFDKKSKSCVRESFTVPYEEMDILVEKHSQIIINSNIIIKECLDEGCSPEGTLLSFYAELVKKIDNDATLSLRSRLRVSPLTYENSDGEGRGRASRTSSNSFTVFTSDRESNTGNGEGITSNDKRITGEIGINDEENNNEESRGRTYSNESEITVLNYNGNYNENGEYVDIKVKGRGYKKTKSRKSKKSRKSRSKKSKSRKIRK